MPDFLKFLQSTANLFAPQQQNINPYPQGDWRTQGHLGIPAIPNTMPNPNIPNPVMQSSINGGAFNDVPNDISQVPIGDPYAGLRDLYQPEHRYSDMMEQMLAQFPQRQKPSLGRKIVASMAGAGQGGIKEADAVINEPYNNAIADWKMRFDPLAQLANTERYTNANARQFASSVLQNDINERKIDETIRKNNMTNSINQQKVNISAQRAKTYEELNQWRMTHPNYTPFAQPDGNVILFDRNSGEALDTGIESGKYDEKELIKARGAIQSGLIKQREGVSDRMEDKRQGNRKEMEGIRQGNREKLVQERAATRAGTVAKDKQLSVSQDAAAWKLARQQHIADNPSHAIFWDPVTGLPTDDAEDDDTGTYESAVNDMRERYNRIKARAVGKSSTSTSAQSKTIRVKAPDGRTGTWDLNKGPIPKGFTEIK